VLFPERLSGEIYALVDDVDFSLGNGRKTRYAALRLFDE